MHHLAGVRARCLLHAIGEVERMMRMRINSTRAVKPVGILWQSSAVRLKQELDRHGAPGEYEIEKMVFAPDRQRPLQPQRLKTIIRWHDRLTDEHGSGEMTPADALLYLVAQARICHWPLDIIPLARAYQQGLEPAAQKKAVAGLCRWLTWARFQAFEVSLTFPGDGL